MLEKDIGIDNKLFIFSATFHPEVFLGDEQVFNSSGSDCDNCIGLRPYNTPREEKEKDKEKHKDQHENKTLGDMANRVRRNDILSDPLPPYDGNLDINSNYTGFVEIIGKFTWLL